MHAHGRTGFIAALLLGRLYGLVALDALERVQRLHDCQWALHGVPATRGISSPKASSQIAMVHELLAGYNDGIYAPLVVENVDEGLFSWRVQQRGTPLERFATKEGFMVSDRPDVETTERQRRDHERLQRVAIREATAARLRAERAREQQRRRELQTEDALAALLREHIMHERVSHPEQRTEDVEMQAASELAVEEREDQPNASDNENTGNDLTTATM
ncbi:hypothetical protein PINS_up003830 [Pythium insidiosum]|nr:hypothetical protein PINS_up003830 [Pythium insidiosum]